MVKHTQGWEYAKRRHVSQNYKGLLSNSKLDIRNGMLLLMENGFLEAYYKKPYGFITS